MNKKAKPEKEAKSLRLQVVMEIDEDGTYIASCPALEACYTQGDTYEEALENIRDVIAMCLDELREESKPLNPRYPEVIGVRQIEVTL